MLKAIKGHEDAAHPPYRSYLVIHELQKAIYEFNGGAVNPRMVHRYRITLF
jgi:hypothetical protein